MPRNAPPRGDVVPLLVVLGLVGLGALVVAVAVLGRALATGDWGAWALVGIPMLGVLLVGVVFQRVSRQSA
jgi:hypothetical protein